MWWVMRVAMGGRGIYGAGLFECVCGDIYARRQSPSAHPWQMIFTNDQVEVRVV